jgi:hypothetical protein
MEPPAGARTDFSEPPDTVGYRLMTEVYGGIAAYRAEHGREPAELGQVLSHVHETAATQVYVMHATEGRNGFCVVAEPRAYHPNRHAWAVDAKGLLFDKSVCMGQAVDVLDPAAVTDP